jgi:CubicO group peptidase (beta-lactamase class C family)
MARLTVRNQTGEAPDELQAEQAQESAFPLAPPGFALSFKTRGTSLGQHPYGSLVSSATFGALGLGSTMFWVDPASGLSFSILTAGLLEEIHSARRFERLSNVVASSVVQEA